MQTVTVIGVVASSLTAVSLLPQMVKIIKEKKSDTMSFGTIAVLFTGLTFWIYYGVLKGDPIIIIANVISLLINTAIFLFSLKYKKDDKR